MDPDPIPEYRRQFGLMLDMRYQQQRCRCGDPLWMSCPAHLSDDDDDDMACDPDFDPTDYGFAKPLAWIGLAEVVFEPCDFEYWLGVAQTLQLRATCTRLNRVCILWPLLRDAIDRGSSQSDWEREEGVEDAESETAAADSSTSPETEFDSDGSPGCGGMDGGLRSLVAGGRDREE